MTLHILLARPPSEAPHAGPPSLPALGQADEPMEQEFLEHALWPPVLC